MRPRGPLFPTAVLLATVLVASGLPSPGLGPLHAQETGNRGWLPVPAERLQGIADAVERARAERDARRERAALADLAKALLDGVPDGGFPIGAGRWIGPGPYLETAARGLDPRDRAQLIDAIDLLVEARLDRDPDPRTLARWLRDLPLSSKFDPERARVAATWLEAGLTESWLDLTAAGSPPGVTLDREAILRTSVLPPPPDDPPPLAQPTRPVLTARWPTSGDERSPWSDGALAVEPIIRGDRLWFATPDGVHCWDPVAGRELWFFPFVVDAPPIVPGVVRAPVLCGPTLIVTTERGILGLDRDSGRVRFEHRGIDLFPARTEPLEPGDARPRSGSPILTISPPSLCERGAVVAASRDQGGTLDLRLLLIDADGNVLWNRDAGSAIGASYLALGSVLVPPRAHGDAIVVATGRGAVLRHSAIDGALVWAAPYPAFAPTATRDALRNVARPRDVRMESDAASLYLTTHDTTTLLVLDRGDGGIRFEIPLGTHRWWALSDPVDGIRTLLLAGPDHWTIWSVPDGSTPTEGPVCRGEYELPPGLPRFSGPPADVGAGWWVPHADGAYRLDRAGPIASIVDAHPRATVRRVLPAGDGILVIGDGFAELRHPSPPEAGTLARWWSAIARGDWETLPDPLPAPSPEISTETAAEEERVARTILWQLRRPGISAALREKIVPAAIERIVYVDERARLAVREARTALRRREGALAVELCWLAMADADPALPIEVEPIGAIDLELAVRYILAQLRDDQQRLPLQDELESRAAVALRGSPGDRITSGIEVHRRCPGTAVGRRAALEAAEELYRFGNLGASLELLEKIVLFEPLNGEAVEARLRIVELATERGDLDRARRRIDELVADFGDLKLDVTTPEGLRTVTVRERCAALAAAIPPADSDTPRPVALPLAPAWRARTELDHIRNLRVAPLDDGERYLTISRRSIGLRVARDGTRVWHRTLPAIPPDERVRSWSDIGRFADPIALDDDTVWMTDRREVLRFELATGAISLRFSLPRLAENEDGTTIQSIERAVLGDGVLVVLGASGILYAFRAEDGEELWQRALAGPLEGPIEIRDGRILLGIQAPAAVEVRSLADGSTLWREDLESIGARLAQEPWFAPLDPRDGAVSSDSTSSDSASAEIVIAYDEGTMRRVDIASGRVRWTAHTPAVIRRIHRTSDPRFWVAELLWTRSTPTLIGFDPETGTFLWQKTFEARRRGLHALIIDDGDLYFVEGDYNRRIASCLEVPRVFHPEERAPGEEPRELRTRWTTPLLQSWDVPRLSVHQDWLLVVDTLSCELTLLSREVGLPIPPRDGFEAAVRFLQGRQRLDFAGFIDGTLVLETARGALGLRTPDPIGDRERLWARLAVLPDSASEGISERPVTDAIRSFRYGHVEHAVTLLESAVEEPTLDVERRRDLLLRLEALTEAVGEDASVQWRIPRVEVPPRIDGSLEEAWNAATAWRIEGARYFHPIQGTVEDANSWHGKRDLSVMLLAAWSDEGFHIALDVTDDSVQAYDNDVDHWNGDCLLLAFDFQGDGGTRTGRDDQLFTLALTVPKRQPPGGGGAPPPEGGDGEDPPGDPPPEEEDEGPQGEFQVIRKGDGSGVIYEATVPWDTFREARGQLSLPHPGMMFRMNLVLTDDDSGRAATSYMSLSTGQMLREERSAVWDVFIPDRFPRILLGR